MSGLFVQSADVKFWKEAETNFADFIRTSDGKIDPNLASVVATSNSRVLTEEELKIEQVRERLREVKQRRYAAQDRRKKLADKLHEMRQLRDELLKRTNELAARHKVLKDELQSSQEDAINTACQLEKYMQINTINDAFYIWYQGPFGTINSFRLGNLPTRAVEWTEINAALGQAVLVISIVAAKAGVVFKRYKLAPMGSFPRVYRVDDRRAVYNLFMDPTLFSLFPKSKFNPALFGFLVCVQELGEHIKHHDPTLSLPYDIEVQEGKTPKIGSRGKHEQLDASWGNDEETWTRALKYVLADIKWIVAWSTKHCL